MAVIIFAFIVWSVVIGYTGWKIYNRFNEENKKK